MEGIASFIIEELHRTNRYYRVRGSNIQIRCPYHIEKTGKVDVNPSCNINTNPYHPKGIPIGTFHCWSCNASGGWEKLADKLKLQPFSEEVLHVVKTTQYINRTKAIKEQANPQIVPSSLEKWTGSWRNLDEEFLKQFDISLWYDEISEVYRALFPVMFGRELKGYIAPRIDTDTQPKIRNSDGLDVENLLFPLNSFPIGKRIILVEGPYDALRLRYYGMNALAILGTSAWTKQKAKIIQSLNPEKVIVAMDGDFPGLEATSRVKHGLYDVDLQPEIFYLPTEPVEIGGVKVNLDPGNMPDNYIEQLKTMYSG